MVQLPALHLQIGFVISVSCRIHILVLKFMIIAVNLLLEKE